MIFASSELMNEAEFAIAKANASRFSLCVLDFRLEPLNLAIGLVLSI